MKRKFSAKLDRSVKVRLGVCAAALGGMASVTPEANAQIVTITPPGGLVVPPTFSGVYINLLDGSTGTSGGSTPGWDFNPYAASGLTQLGFYWAQTPAGTSGGVVANATTQPYISLNNGDTVGPASTFSQIILGTTSSAFLTTGTHILGFRFFNENTSATNYGFLTMTNTGGGSPNGFPTTIISWTYDASGAPITVPEPSSLFLTAAAMCAGARGLRKWRRKQAA